MRRAKSKAGVSQAKLVLLLRLDSERSKLREAQRHLDAANVSGDRQEVERRKMDVAYREACVSTLVRDFEKPGF